MAIVKTISQLGNEKIEINIQVNDDFKVQNNPKPLSRGNSGKEVIAAAKDLFGDGLALTRNCAAKVIESVNQMSDDIKPNEFEMKLSITLDSEAGVPMLAKAGAEAQMEVTMKWKLKE
ncbi:hypothetical protein Tery_2162 [Trichodesmium erythraeum IMS101]|uniref:Trypsin-co-occurring domain-containing protein n=1 Tax=Trichodesmium erythraeum (strain IMS101) TaxID=203124 RepID=Q113C9_TRIEI|nr:hypothetical protein [Trichodesmium erythraeum GBRTRLIN201]